MKNLKVYTIPLLIVTMLISSCAKDGDTGPTGATGADGNANVKAISFSVSPGSWNTAGSSGQVGHIKYYEKNISEITQDIIDNGMVITYLVDNGYDIMLPLTLFAGNYDINFTAGAKVGTLEIDVAFSDLSTPNIVGTSNFKAVIVDGTVRMQNLDLNWNDYKAVSQRFNIED
jgi:hypothetical protein